MQISLNSLVRNVLITILLIVVILLAWYGYEIFLNKGSNDDSSSDITTQVSQGLNDAVINFESGDLATSRKHYQQVVDMVTNSENQSQIAREELDTTSILADANVGLASIDRQDAGLQMQSQMRQGNYSFETLANSPESASSLASFVSVANSNENSAEFRAAALNRIVSTYTDMWSNYLLPIKYVYTLSPWNQNYQKHLTDVKTNASVSETDAMQIANGLTLIDILEQSESIIKNTEASAKKALIIAQLLHTPYGRSLSEAERNNYWTELGSALNTQPQPFYRAGTKYVCYQYFSLARAASLVANETDLPASLKGYVDNVANTYEQAIGYCESHLADSGLMTADSGVRLYYASYLWNTQGETAIAKINQVIQPVLDSVNDERWDYSGFLMMLRMSPIHASEMHITLPLIAEDNPNLKTYINGLGINLDNMKNVKTELFKFF